ncbi:hypothetical protein [Aestuariivirga litoralis]|uniref:hypothetical protein n=1 Tax=Aestuariivirga litoralis TaxID=2650924 RepID=UPI0011B43E44|nr:hypothetical protein [Aestuariivirga litoralis]
MSLDIEGDATTPRAGSLTRIEPATFRGVDCAVLAERYAAYRRGTGLDAAPDDPDTIKLTPPASSEIV